FAEPVMTPDFGVSRRRFFRVLGSIAAAITATPADRPKQAMTVRSARPEDFEMTLEGFDSWITPVEHFFVRSHMSRPEVELGSWRLSVGGELSSPLNLTMEELKRFPAVEVVSVLECAGNGRSF